jgi:lysozyme family protein
MTEDQVIDGVFAREGDTYGDQRTRPPIDQPTARGGIILATLLAFVAATRSPLPPTVETLKTMTHPQAREIVRWMLRELARQHGLDQIPYDALRHQAVDWAYNSGPGIAIRWLQRVLGVPRTGRMDAVTVAAVKYPDAKRVPVWLSESLLAARLRMIDMVTDPGGKVDHKYEEGLENRALSFSLLEVP